MHSIRSHQLAIDSYAFTDTMARGEEYIEHEEDDDDDDDSKETQREQGFTEAQKKQLAAIGVSDEIRALVGRSSSGSNSSSSTGVRTKKLPSIISLARRLGIFQPVHIIHLDVSFSSIDSSGLSLLARHCPSLLKVNISGCEKITNSGVRDLARYCRSIQVFHMDLLPCLDDSAIQDVIHGLKQLLSLDIGSCIKMSNISFQIIGTHGHHLQHMLVHM